MKQLELKQILIIERGEFKKELVADVSEEAVRLTSSGICGGKLQERPELLVAFDSEYSDNRMINFDDVYNLVGIGYGAVFYRMNDEGFESLTDEDCEWIKATYNEYREEEMRLLAEDCNENNSEYDDVFNEADFN